MLENLLWLGQGLALYMRSSSRDCCTRPHIREMVADKIAMRQAIHVAHDQRVETTDGHSTVKDPGFAETSLFLSDVLNSVWESRRPLAKNRGVVLIRSIISQHNFEIAAALHCKRRKRALNDVGVVVGPDNDRGRPGWFHRPSLSNQMPESVF